MAIHSTIAQLVTRRRGLVWAAVALISAASIAGPILRMKLDTEVLNLLPGGFDRSRTEVYNRDFAQVRDLTFALVCQPADADSWKNSRRNSPERLRNQPWCGAFSRRAMETAEGVHDLHPIAVPLLLNLDPADLTKL